MEAVLTEDEANHKYMLSCFVCFFKFKLLRDTKRFPPVCENISMCMDCFLQQHQLDGWYTL